MRISTTFDKQEVIGMFKGSRDHDILFTKTTQMLGMARRPKWTEPAFRLAEGLTTLTTFLAATGNGMVIFGWGIKPRSVNNIEAIESACSEAIAGLENLMPAMVG